jgi:hypothetical protein
MALSLVPSPTVAATVVRACRVCVQPFTIPAIPQLPGRYCSLKCAEAAARVAR